MGLAVIGLSACFSALAPEADGIACESDAECPTDFFCRVDLGRCQEGSCSPSCQGKCPGADDGCGGTCVYDSCVGSCEGATCLPDPCTPDCAGKCPGSRDGCGGECFENDCPGCCDQARCIDVDTKVRCSSSSVLVECTEEGLVARQCEDCEGDQIGICGTSSGTLACECALPCDQEASQCDGNRLTFCSGGVQTVRDCQAYCASFGFSGSECAENAQGSDQCFCGEPCSTDGARRCGAANQLDVCFGSLWSEFDCDEACRDASTPQNPYDGSAFCFEPRERSAYCGCGPSCSGEGRRRCDGSGDTSYEICQNSVWGYVNCPQQCAKSSSSNGFWAGSCSSGGQPECQCANVTERCTTGRELCVQGGGRIAIADCLSAEQMGSAGNVWRLSDCDLICRGGGFDDAVRCETRNGRPTCICR